MLKCLRRMLDISYCDIKYYVIYVIYSHYVRKAISSFSLGTAHMYPSGIKPATPCFTNGHLRQLGHREKCNVSFKTLSKYCHKLFWFLSQTKSEHNDKSYRN